MKRVLSSCFLFWLCVACQAPKEVLVPEGMVHVPQGENIPAFFMDESPVTVAQFRRFVKATSYVTDAEKFGNAAVFSVEANWFLKDGANWEFPLGKDQEKAQDNHPVTQVSYQDAVAYAQWAGKRLPNALEWEHAAKDGVETKTIYNWGNTLVVDGAFKANTWQGSFPYVNTNEDGFLHTSPVGHFGKTKLGLSDISGNVWEWTSDWELPYGTDAESFQPNESSAKILRGGSFLCDPRVCHGYQITGKTESTPETSLMHTGFRCVKDITAEDYKTSP